MNLYQVLLGAIQIKPALSPYALPNLELEQFPADLQPVFAALSGFWEAKGVLDTVQLCARYPAQQEAILGCVEACQNECIAITRERVEQWVQLIREQYALTRFQSLSMQAAGTSTTFSDLPELWSQMGEALTLDRDEQDFKPIGELVDDYIRRLDEKPQYIPTGLSILDKHLHLSPGNLFIIGGRPSAGKTALALQMAIAQAHRGIRVCFFSLETDPTTLTNRIISNCLAAPLANVKDKTVSQSELDDLAGLHDLPLFIRSASGKGVGWVKAQAQRMRAQVIFIDYLQLLADGKGKDRYQAITGISIALHELAQRTGILVVALAQLNRNSAQTLPTVADLKESGQIEQDADAILLLANDVTSKERPEPHYHCSLEKNKEGGLWTIPITFDKPRQRFLTITSELERR